MTQGEQFQGEDGERRARRAQERFNAILQRLTWFAAAILVLIAGSVALKYWIALKEIDLKKIELANLARAQARSGETGSRTSDKPAQRTQWSTERTAEYINDYLAIQAHNTDGGREPAKISRPKFLDFLNSLEISGTLSKEAVGAVHQLREKLIDASIDVSADTIKKLTAKLFAVNDKPDLPPKADPAPNNWAVNVTCAVQPAPVTKTNGPKTNPPQKMMCPVPLVPFSQKK